jgi:predicted RNase H-like nuclease (RuvC/YqgF family)
MKIIYYAMILILILVACPSCDKEVNNLREEIKSLRNENNFLKAESIALKKELEEVYKRIDEKDLIKQKPVVKEKEENLNKETTSKKPDKVGPDRIKKPENGKTGR